MYDNSELIEKSKNGDRAAREKLIEANLGLVHSVVKKFLGRGYDAEDIFQIGCIGIIKAADKFEPSYGVKFSTYAVPMIMGEIKRFMRDDGLIKVSRRLKETASKACGAKERLEKKLGREPTVSEIAVDLGEDIENVVMALEAATPAESLNKTVYSGDRGEIYLIDKLADENGNEDELVDRIALTTAISRLDERDRRIIALRYYKGKTQREISSALGISQVQVSRIEKRILGELKEKVR